MQSCDSQQCTIAGVRAKLRPLMSVGNRLMEFRGTAMLLGSVLISPWSSNCRRPRSCAGLSRAHALQLCALLAKIEPLAEDKDQHDQLLAASGVLGMVMTMVIVRVVMLLNDPHRDAQAAADKDCAHASQLLRSPPEVRPGSHGGLRCVRRPAGQSRQRAPQSRI